MKKILSLALCALMSVAVFVGCSSGDADSNANSDASSSVADTVKDVSAKEVVDTIMKAGEWPMLQPIEDNAMLKEYMLIDAESPDFEEVYAVRPMMSGVISEVIVIKAVDGKIDAAKSALEARKEKLVSTDAFYPEHKEFAENAVIETVGNYAILICHEKTDEGLKAAQDFLNN